MNQLTSRSINWLRIALVILVLFVHVHPDHNPHWLTLDNLSGQPLGWVIFSVIGTFINKFAFIAVPLFFTISGYLFFHKLETWSWSVWKQKIRSRVRTLLIPFIIFNVICAISLLCLSLKNGGGWTLAGAYEGRWPLVGWLWNGVSYCQGWKNWLGMDMQLYYPLDVPLWFVRDLMVMLALSPAIYWLISKGGALYLGVGGIAYCLGVLCCAPGFSTNALFFFSIGAFAAIRGIDPVEWSRKNIKWILPVFMCFWIVGSIIVAPGNAQPFENLTFIFGIPVCFWIGGGVMVRKAVESNSLTTTLSTPTTPTPPTAKYDSAFITGACFFIYCIHMVNFGNWNLLAWANQVGSQIFNLDNPAIASIAYLTEIALIMAAGTLTYWLLKRFLPRLSGIITGGR